ncbi:MAG: DNA translocase FtsK 4TM domain-containing protein [Methylococcaceae bacterium]
MSVVMEEKTFRGVRELLVLVCSVGAVFFLIALLSFNSHDMGWTHSGDARYVTNTCGVMGAWLADFSLSLLGWSAYTLPSLMAWYAYALQKNQSQTILTSAQGLGYTLSLLASTASCSLYIPRLGTRLPNGTGGIIGQEMGDGVLKLVGNSGATLFLAMLLLIGASLLFKVSWLTLLDLIGKYTLIGFDLLHGVFFKAKQSTNAESVPSTEYTFTNDTNTSAPLFNKNNKPEVAKTVLMNTPQIPVQSLKIINQPPLKATKKPSRYKGKKLPSLDLLDSRENNILSYSIEDLDNMARRIETILADFNVTAQVVGFYPGPVITRFELQPAAGIKASRITGLSKELARALLVTSVRVVEIIAGKSVIGLEIPNREREMVSLRELLESNNFNHAKSKLTLALGKDIAGTPLVADLGKMPHILVAGTTGSGKSVAINSMILSLLYKATPEQVRLIMIDPKMLELSVYEGIPHLLTPVVTDMKEASNALRWAVAEMERRYQLMSKMGVRNLAGYNQLINDATERGEAIRDPLAQIISASAPIAVLTTLPSIVIVIDELADMMMMVGKKVEEQIARLAQKARAAGIHLLLATQRPSVDVLTGLIKANVPTRLSFQVSSRIDSRTILDQGGAESLLGNGDMLFLPSGTSIPIRAHGAFVDDAEVHRVVEFLKHTAPPNYLEEITQDLDETYNGESDPLYDAAVRYVTESRKASISVIQRRFKIGYNRAAILIDAMETADVISTPQANGSRVVLAPAPIKEI